MRAIVQPVQVNITDNVLIGQNQITAALSGPDEQTREARRADLTNAFFTDLRALGQVLLLMDTFEKGDETVRAWLAGSFLPRAQRSPQLFVVLAGQRMPEQALDWECRDVTLGPIDPEHWLEYAQSLSIQLSIDLIQNCWRSCNGRTDDIAKTLRSLAPQEWSL